MRGNSYFGLFLAWFLLGTLCAKHHLYVGNLSRPASLHAFEFDDETLRFTLTKTFTADASHAWIAFNHDKTNIYGASLQAPQFASYAVNKDLSLELINTVSAAKECFNHTSAYVMASATHPYRVVTGAWPGPEACGMSLNVTEDGTLDQVTDSWTYTPDSGIHGLSFGDVASGLVYSADLNGDAIWTHSISPKDGKATEVGRLSVKSGSHPRHLASHPQGKWAYAVMEAGNRLAAFSVNETTGQVAKEEATFTLLPGGSNSSDYWSAEVMLSSNNKYLWATARAKMNSNNTGFISAFLLDRGGEVVKRMFRVPTTTLGGIANAVSPAPWGSEWAAMTDYSKGYVQVWRMIGKKMGVYGVEYSSAKAVARVDIADGGCCANTIWYD